MLTKTLEYKELNMSTVIKVKTWIQERKNILSNLPKTFYKKNPKRKHPDAGPVYEVPSGRTQREPFHGNHPMEDHPPWC